MTQKIIVFYDGSCSLCHKEIRYYQRIAKPGVFDFQDITQDGKVFNQLGYETETGLKIMHVQDAYGVMQTGVDAFITMWRNLGWFKVLAILANLPGIKSLLNWVYLRFAKWRYAKMQRICRLS